MMLCANEFPPQIAEGEGDSLVISVGRAKGVAKTTECDAVKVTGWEGSSDGLKFEDVSKASLPGVKVNSNGSLTVEQGDKALHFHPLLTAGAAVFPGYIVTVGAKAGAAPQQSEAQYFGADGKLLPPGSPAPNLPPKAPPAK